jgi:hypothetical protein
MFTQQLFELALNIQDPWFIKDIQFSAENKRLDIHIDFRKGSVFHYELTDENIKQLSIFIRNLKFKRKKEREELAQRQEQELTYEEKGKYFVAQKTNELQQSLLMPMTKEERTALIEDSITQNLWLFLEYMEKQQALSADFLEIIIGL